MHCFLHIGVEKTGTTSIQKFLYLNRALLNQNGYQLTDSLSKPNNTGITVLSLSSLKNEEIKYFSVVSSEQKFNKKKQFLKWRIKEEVKKAKPGSKFIFSNEHMHSLLSSREEIDFLKRFLESIGFTDFTVLVFVRPIIEMVRSRRSTAFKNANINIHPRLQDASKENFPYLFNLKESFNKWISVFGKKNIKVMRFDSRDKDLLYKKFLDGIDFDFKDINFAIPEISNKSLSYEAMLSLYSNKSEILKRYKKRKHLMNFIQELKNEFMHQNGNKISIFEDILKSFETRFKEDNLFILKEFNIDLKTNYEIQSEQTINYNLLKDLDKYIISRLGNN